LWDGLFGLIALLLTFPGRPLTVGSRRAVPVLPPISHGRAVFVRHIFPTLTHRLSILVGHVLHATPRAVAVLAILAARLVALGTRGGTFFVAHAVPFSPARITLSLAGLVGGRAVIADLLSLRAAQ
jgi:hypothetical protein